MTAPAAAPPAKRFGPPDGRGWMGWSWTEKEDDLPQKNLAVAHFEDRHGYSPKEIHEESERRYMWLGPVGPVAETPPAKGAKNGLV